MNMLTSSTYELANTQKWLSLLPHGLASFPQCRASAQVVRDLHDEYPTLAKLTLLPLTWKYIVTEIPQQVDWIPEVHVQLIMLVIRDVLCASDTEFLQGVRKRANKAFSGPLMRQLMRITSINLLAVGISKRWTSLHQGTTMNFERGKQQEAIFRLDAYAHLFPLLFLRNIATTLETALFFTGKKGQVTLKPGTDGTCMFHANWLS